MSAEAIKPGDVVQLNSGGKKWTAKRIDEDEAICTDENGQEASFLLVQLKKVGKPKVGAVWLGRKVFRE